MKLTIITTGDLIKELQKYPQDTPIFDLGGDRFEEIEVCADIPLGDPANPNCEFVKGILLI